eukprot:TRINITY_DN16154_c0_g1_i2.p1 TRINITY_DN16154_c0_g1~~TRINITY_DN16154_c0_g1_i2.p1  ORF type:complete len:374 (+),score=65.57 TRINITY_DN16154_c0_g1_i2:709-1830(+)
MHQNFGYDPSRNHYPNEGNAAITYTNDQVGVNARSLDDIITWDAALLGLECEHEAARQTAPALKDLRVGLPQWPFVEHFVPNGCYSSFGLGHVRVSANMEAKYEGVKKALGNGGAVLVNGEWPEIFSARLGRSINSLTELMYGRVVNGKPCDTGLYTSIHAFSGLASQFVARYLEAPVSLNDLISDIQDLGDGHTPGKFLALSGHQDESQFRYVMALQAEYIQVYNSYFDAHDVDVILIPGLLSDAMTWEDMIGGTCPMQMLADGEWRTVRTSSIHAIAPSMFSLKNIPIPKLMVPTGLDAEGRPTGVQLWGRAPSPERLYDDEYAKTFDLDFLHMAKVLVDCVHKEPSLRRADAPLVSDVSEAFTFAFHGGA